MFNLGMAPRGNILDEQFFVGSIGVASAELEYVLNIHPAASFVYLFVQGGGAGGGGGFTRASLTQGGGGGGGAGGGNLRLLVPTFFLPKQLIIRPSNGGLGGAAGSPGVGPSAGALTLFGQPSTSRLTVALGGAGTVAGAGTGAAGGAGGAVNTATTTANLGFFPTAVALASNALQAGGAGNATTNGATPTSAQALFGQSGGGGAGVTTGDVVGTGGAGASPLDTASGRQMFTAPTTPAGAGNAGIHGQTHLTDNFIKGSTGGSGGNSGGVVAGGRGGDGGYGSGGGGGGAGTTGGAGGKGGPGFVYVVQY